MSHNDNDAGVGGGSSARSGGQESVSICEFHQKHGCWFGMKCKSPHSLEEEEIERAKRCHRRFERKKKRSGSRHWSNPRGLSRKVSSLGDTLHDAIEGMQEELRAFRVAAVTEGDRFEKLEAENKRLERENALLKEEKLQQDEELEKVRASAETYLRAMLQQHEVRASVEEYLRDEEATSARRAKFYAKQEKSINRLLSAMREEMCVDCCEKGARALKGCPGITWDRRYRAANPMPGFC
mmetsp:Transcript_36207/g.56660  ORF Transcript_36207/g.56660 Transcript_36207/m.56660 type:complete len:239 (+) Transcript_36207:257-973(+)